MQIAKKLGYIENISCAECGASYRDCYEISTSDSFHKICFCEECFHKLAMAMESVNEFTTLLKFE